MAIGANINMIKVSCSFCGRKPDNEKFDSDFWPLYTRNIDSYSNVCICNACKIRHPNAFDFYFSEKEEEPMDYNKKKDTSIDVMRDVTREEVVTVNSIRDLAAGDKIKVMINGEVYEAKVARRPPIDYSGETELAIAVNIDKPLSKTWKDLGYDCFEDMIDDIARKHKEEKVVKPRYKYYGCLDAADSYGESYVEIEQNGAKTIVHSDNVTVYPVRKEDD